ncbi:hypothetical protein GUITHDRAFT_154025 [Guillardia theta CCMP2712]|uniref:Uncharacterized protein n=1 Tax=Guillardia theta (strain CCMP2712) TaxID=905079 RepID=L1IY91_GUITC|nr:hypothetical protein GUITHDRAFT_154025 [Guillardia theta CCMP2712]EKX40849.1 hypothetical protein GUITHDRAFT_154025 [Guillardia theta CCMP2712]|eukprot:XP_005827829.1 hypothetical protein GUITHDRAFT_154025 [Guillardia theta CCMP2712]
MFAILRQYVEVRQNFTMLTLDANGNDVDALLKDVNTINTWAEPHNANGITPNTVIDSNDEPPGNNQQRMAVRGY